MAMITQAGVDKLIRPLRDRFDLENDRRDLAVEVERLGQQAEDLTHERQAVRERYANDPVFRGPTQLFDAPDIMDLPASIGRGGLRMSPSELVRTEKQRVQGGGRTAVRRQPLFRPYTPQSLDALPPAGPASITAAARANMPRSPLDLPDGSYEDYPAAPEIMDRRINPGAPLGGPAAPRLNPPRGAFDMPGAAGAPTDIGRVPASELFAQMTGAKPDYGQPRVGFFDSAGELWRRGKRRLNSNARPRAPLYGPAGIYTPRY
ncbi:MAG: hypothetical protein HYV75_08595 [Opitutae bacterium]|nr:hypothetical protein [Opitutae bacterium]